ncbi:MAG: 2-oxoacid:acceptor oxidoreductase family protein [Magnetococcus sp. DMHC-6]
MTSKSTENSRTFPFPGIPGTGDGSEAVSYVETRATDGAVAYPITPSTNMGQFFQIAVANGFKNVWGKTLAWMEPESEHSSASACEGFTLAGGRITNFTSGQGLILMKEVLYTISGKRLPTVLHVAARTLTSQGLCIHAGHDDVMGVADTGWGILFAKNIQEVADLSLICRHASENSLTPFMNVQDGFLLSHTIENLFYPEDELIRVYLGDPRDKVRSLFDVDFPLQSGPVQNQDSYMSGKIAQRLIYERLPKTIEESMEAFYRLTGRRYQAIETFHMEDAEYAIICMGTLTETALSVIPIIRKQLGIRIGVVNITCYRPFPAAQMVKAIANCKAVTVLERCDIPTMVDNPLTTDIEASLARGWMGQLGIKDLKEIPYVFSGVGGLGSRNVTPGHMLAIARNMVKGKKGKRFFTVGVDHHSTLDLHDDEPDVRPSGSFSVRVHSVGGYGSVTTNKVIATMLGDIFGFNVQAAPKYGSEKKGLPTNSFLAVSPGDKILAHCDLQQVDFVPLMDPTTWHMGNPLVGLGKKGIVFQHTHETTVQGLWDALPSYAKYFIRENNIRFYGVDTIAIARESCTSDASLIQRFQGVVLLGVFLRVTPFQESAGMDQEKLFAKVRNPLKKYFGKRGEGVVDENLEAVIRGYKRVMEVTRDIMDATPIEIMAEGKIEWENKGKDVSAFIV